MEYAVITQDLIVLLLLVIIIWYILFQIRRRPLYKLAAQFDGPKPLPIIGNAFNCMVSGTEMADSVLTGMKHYKSPTRLWFGPFFTVCVWSPEDLRIVLTNQYALGKLPYAYKLFEQALGRGLITVPVHEWKQRRRIISPTFNQQNLEIFVDIFYHYSRAMVGDLKKEEGKTTFHVDGYILSCIMNMLMESVLGVKADENGATKSSEIEGWLFDMATAIMDRISNILYFSDFIFKLSPTGKRLSKTREEFKKHMNKIINSWKENLTNRNKEDSQQLENIGTPKPKNFVELLLSTSDEMGVLTADEVLAEVNTILIAGLETTSTMMGFVLVALGMHPDIQFDGWKVMPEIHNRPRFIAELLANKVTTYYKCFYLGMDQVYEEIKNVQGSKDQLQLEDLKSFEYLERVIKEALRIFPIGAGIARYTERDIQLENHTIPAGSNILISLLALHRDPNIWPNPTKFDPDRFLPEEVKKRHPYSWIPFSGGPRNCIGLRYALLAMQIMTIQIVRTYKIHTGYKSIEDVHFTMIPILKPTEGYQINITAR